MTTIQIVSLVIFYVCGLITGYFLSRKDEPAKESKPKKNFEQFDEKTFFVSPVNPAEAFESSKTVDQFISKIQ